MGLPVVSVTVEVLRVSAERQRDAADACVGVREVLSTHWIQPAVAGSVPAAAAFHAVLVHVLDQQADDAAEEQVRRAELAGRASRTAGLGAGLVRDSTAVARGAPVPPMAAVPGGS